MALQSKSPKPTCYLDGQFVSPTSAVIPISDLGFIHGVTVTEQLRTINGKPFLLEKHFERFYDGLDLIEHSVDESRDEIRTIVSDLVQNFLEQTEASDCGIGFFATPGTTARFGQSATQSRLGIYCYPLPFSELREIYKGGFQLGVAETQDVSKACWPKTVKIRSRLHYYLADREGRRKGFTAIIADENGNLRDTSVAAPVFVFEAGKLTLPPESEILPSISLEYVCDLSLSAGLKVERREIHRSEISQIKSMALVNSIFCIARVHSIDSNRLPENGPDELHSIGELWKKECGLDFRDV